MALTFTEVLPLPAGDFGARCSCGWFEEGPHAGVIIDEIVREHAESHRQDNGGITKVGLRE